MWGDLLFTAGLYVRYPSCIREIVLISKGKQLPEFAMNNALLLKRCALVFPSKGKKGNEKNNDITKS